MNRPHDDAQKKGILMKMMREREREEEEGRGEAESDKFVANY